MSGIDVIAVIQHIKKLEHPNNQDFMFVLHADGSGCFEGCFQEEVYQHFDTIQELESIVCKGNLKEIKI